MNKMDNHETEPNHFMVYEYDYKYNWGGGVQSCGVTAGRPV